MFESNSLLTVAIIYFVLIALIIPLAILDLWNANRFYKIIQVLFSHNNLHSQSLKAAIRQTSVKRIYVIKKLTELYLDELNKNKENMNIASLQTLLDEYESEIDFPDLPKSIIDKIKLIKTENTFDKENIKQLANVINDLYLSEKKYKRCSIMLSLLGIVLTIVSIYPFH